MRAKPEGGGKVTDPTTHTDDHTLSVFSFGDTREILHPGGLRICGALPKSRVGGENSGGERVAGEGWMKALPQEEITNLRRKRAKGKAGRSWEGQREATKSRHHSGKD